MSLIHHLLHLPHPPQILFLPPFPSPLPDSLLTILHTIRLSAEAKSTMAQLHCEPLPRTPKAVREFTQKWGTGLKGTVAEGGRRVDAVVLGEGWEVELMQAPDAPSDSGAGSSSPTASGPEGTQPARKPKPRKKAGKEQKTGVKEEQEKGWTIEQFQYHFLTSLLPALTRAPAERSIRVITLVSPAWRTALASLGVQSPADPPVSGGLASLLSRRSAPSGPLGQSSNRGILTLLLMRHFQLVLNTLASAAYSKVPSANGDVPLPMPLDSGSRGKKREEGLQSNIMAISVVMPWTRNEVIKRILYAEEGNTAVFTYALLWPFIWLFTPSASRAIHSILFALSAPIRYSPLQPVAGASAVRLEKDLESRRTEVRGGDVIQNCAVIDLTAHVRCIHRSMTSGVKGRKSDTDEISLPQALRNPALARTCYDTLEKEVESRVKADEAGILKAASASAAAKASTR